MFKKFFSTIVALGAVLATSPAVLAAPAEAAKAAESGDFSKAIFFIGAMIAAGLAMGIGAFGVGIGIGNAASNACQAVGRNPGAQGKIMTTMLVGMAMAESVAIYCLVVAMILLLANPFSKFIVG